MILTSQVAVPSSKRSRAPRGDTRRAFSLTHCLGLGLGLAAVFASAPDVLAQTVWTGAINQDWNTAGNWTNGVPTNVDGSDVATRIENTTATNYPIFTTGPQTDYDIFLGSGAGNNARLDQTAGTLATGPTNWMFVGENGGTGTYNLSGTGNLNAGSLNVGAWSAPGSTGTANINTSGTLNFTDGARGGDIGDASLLVGENGNTGTFNLQNGTANALRGAKFGHGAPTVNGTVTPSVGNVNVSGGTLNVTGETWVANRSGTSTVTQTGGTVSSTGYFVIGRLAGTGTYNLSAGTINAATGFGGSEIGSAAGSTGTMTVSGTGVFNSTAGGLIVGNGWTDTGTATGTLNVEGNGSVNLGAQTLTVGVATGNAVGNGTINLNGGSIQAGSVVTTGTGNTSTFNFNGGTLTATQTNATYLTGLTTANVRNGGAKINTNGFDVTVDQALNHSGLTGDAAIDGGLAKSGGGNLMLTAASNYTGATAVNGGTLELAATGSLVSSRSLTVTGGASLTLDNATALPDTLTLSLINGTKLNLNAATGIETIGTLLLNGTAVPIGTYTAAQLSSRPNATGIAFTSAGETLRVTSVPEPSTFAIGAMGLVALAGLSRRRQIESWLQQRRMS